MDKGREIAERIKENIKRVIVGKDETISLLITALVSGGHVLLLDMPGTGKTKLAKSLSKSLSLEFGRIQFTPDLLPSDILGLNYFSQKEGEFIFRKGPVFTSILLADEINRATPRTQSSLLECMEEHQVTIDGETRKLSDPFFVIATENPIETAGTYPLPEAQTDRFFMVLEMGYPSKSEEIDILSRFSISDPLDTLQSVCNKEDLDVTGHFLQGAKLALDMAQKHSVKIAILKANSPSCGNVQIYSGRFDGEKIPGAGVAAALLMENGIKVYSEQEIDEDLLKRLIAEDRG